MRFLLTLGTVAFLATPALAAAPKQTSPAQVTVNLTPVRGSNQHGTAVLTQHGDKLTVAIHMSMPHGMKTQESGSPMMMRIAPMGAHFHRGSCPNPEKQPLYPLNPVVNGNVDHDAHEHEPDQTDERQLYAEHSQVDARSQESGRVWRHQVSQPGGDDAIAA